MFKIMMGVALGILLAGTIGTIGTIARMAYLNEEAKKKMK
jgi:hypothetical protein